MGYQWIIVRRHVKIHKLVSTNVRILKNCIEAIKLSELEKQGAYPPRYIVSFDFEFPNLELNLPCFS